MSSDSVPQWVIVAIGGLGGFIFGYDTGIMSTARRHIEAEYGVVDPTLSGFITSVVLFGAMAGSLPGGLIVNRFGRKMTCFIGNSICLFGGIVTSFSMHLAMFMVLRILLGVGVGLLSFICPLYVSETAPSTRKGSFGSLFQLSITLGILLSYVVGFAFDQLENKSLAWRLMLGSGGVLFPLLLYPVILFRMVEVSPELLPRDSEPLLQHPSKHDQSETGGYLGLCVPRRLTQTIMGIVLAAVLQLTGINAIMYFGPSIISKAGFQNEVLLNIIIGGWNFLTTFVALFLVERVGRRVLMLGGTTVMSLSLIEVGLCFKFITDDLNRGIGVGLGLLAFIAGFEGGPGCMFWVLVNEIFDKEVKEAGASTANVLQWGFNLLVSSLFLNLFETLGNDVTFYLFGGFGVVCTIYMMFMLKDK